MNSSEGVLRYGDSPWQQVHLYGIEAERPSTPVVLVHGGFWRHDRTARDLEPMAVALSGRGCRVAVVEYRPVWDGGGWPAVAHDAARAIDALSASGVDWDGGWFVGHSAGAHVLLSAVAGRAAGYRVCLLAPVADVALAAAHGLGDGAANHLTATHVRSGGRIDDATPRPSPADVSALHVVAAAEDQAVPAGVVAAQVEDWARAGLPVRYRSLPDARHMHLVNPARAAGASVLEMLSAGQSVAT